MSVSSSYVNHLCRQVCRLMSTVTFCRISNFLTFSSTIIMYILTKHLWRLVIVVRNITILSGLKLMHHLSCLCIPIPYTARLNTLPRYQVFWIVHLVISIKSNIIIYFNKFQIFVGDSCVPFSTLINQNSVHFHFENEEG